MHQDVINHETQVHEQAVARRRGDEAPTSTRRPARADRGMDRKPGDAVLRDFGEVGLYELLLGALDREDGARDQIASGGLEEG